LALLIISFSSSLSQPAGKWSPSGQLPGLTNPQFVFADSMIGYYIGQDTGFVTRNGGVTWAMMTFPPNAIPAPSFLFAPDHNTVIAYQKARTDGIAVPGIIISADMGATWSVVMDKNIPRQVKAFTMWTSNDGIRIWLDDITTND